MRKEEMTDKVQIIVRTCVFVYRNRDGATDNCSASVRAIRKRIHAYALAAFVMLTWSLALSARAQGLVGAPIHIPSCDFSYDTAIDISRVITAISFLITFIIPLAKSKRANVKQCALELIGLASIPILVHFVGIFVINNFGDISSGWL